MSFTDQSSAAIDPNSHSAVASSSSHAEWIPWLVSNRAALALIDQGIVSGASFLTSLAVGRYLGKESLGVYFLAAGLFTLLQCISDQIIHVPYLVHVPHFDDSRTRQYSASAFVHAIVLTLFAVVAVAIGAITRQASAEGDQLSRAMLALAVCFPGMMLRDFLHNYLHNRLRQFEVTCLDALVTGLQIAALGSLVLSDYLSIVNVVLVIGVACSVIGVAWLPRLIVDLEFHSGRILPDFLFNWTIGKWALGSYLIGSSAPTILPWFLASTAGIDDTGLFAACLTLIGIAQVLLRGAGKYMAPRMVVAFVQGGRASLARYVSRTLHYTLALMTVVTAGMIVFGNQLISLGFGSQYSGVQATIFVLSLGCWLQTIDIVAGNALLAMGHSRLNFIGDCIRCLLTIVSAAALIGELGPLGAALSMVIGTFAGLLVRIWYLRRELGDQQARGSTSIVGSRGA